MRGLWKIFLTPLLLALLLCAMSPEKSGANAKNMPQEINSEEEALDFVMKHASAQLFKYYGQRTQLYAVESLGLLHVQEEWNDFQSKQRGDAYAGIVGYVFQVVERRTMRVMPQTTVLVTQDARFFIRVVSSLGVKPRWQRMVD